MNRMLVSSLFAATLIAGNALAADPAYRIERVTFTSGGETLVGNLYVPRGASAAAPAPAAVVTGAWMTVKEQMAGRYASELASRGLVALAFDFRSWGESGGQPRAMESPIAKTEDIRAAVAFLHTRSEIAKNRIGALGICASAAYVAAAAANTPGIASVALVAPWLHDRKIVDAVYGGPDTVQKLIDAGREADRLFRASGKQTLVPAASTTDKTAIMFNVPYYTERHRGLVPQWENRFNVASWEGWLTLDAMPAAARIKQPLLVVHSDAAAIPQGAKQFYAQVKSAKRDVWLDNVSQFDFYDDAKAVARSADAVAEHLRARR